MARHAGRDFHPKHFAGPLVAAQYRRTWAFPKEVEDLLVAETKGESVLHLFGGMASWGTRLDADPQTRPTVLGNAFYPPFGCESFDHVILDPPYDFARDRIRLAMLCAAACVARRRVWWFHEIGCGGSYHGLKIRRWWAVVASSHGHMRFLVELERTKHPKTCTWRSRLPAIVSRYDWSQELEQCGLWE